MKRLIIADAHLGQRSGDSEIMADLVTRAAQSGYGELVYLGDAFQYLIGMPKFWTSAVREVMSAWQQARSHGARIALVEGNRDFFLDEPMLSDTVDWTGLRYELSAGRREFLLVHGDRVNRRDLQYLFWAAVSKCMVARLFAQLLPEKVAVAIVRKMERRLAKTNRKYRYRIPDQELRRSAEAAWADGFDVVLWGHFHAAWEYSTGPNRALILPAWLDARNSLEIDEEGGMTLVDASLAPCQNDAMRAETESDHTRSRSS